ncbi:Arm DNA-binding domain-containing protein [Candidatus Odyssella thessalonicensis]|uniref:Arm DNA-binding domain-containing protein n=1 Tax=Candidatus Odyssella thessalonicensis TaxID=84647 RepID=UPI00030CB677|nr:Arm DNA-binding domain-containing protein [Candidatus Odyssella thessalonicensis]
MSDNRKFNFTKKALEALDSIDKDKTYFYDTKVHGLTICVTKSGVKTFYLYRKVAGRPERIRIGKFPDLSIENARGEASKLNHMIEKGMNPNQEKQKLKSELTFADLFDRYLTQHAKIYKKSWEEDLRQFERYLKPLSTKRLSSLNRSMFQALHTKIGKDHGPYAANRTLALLKTVFNKANLWGWDGENPIIGIQKFKEKSRERFCKLRNCLVSLKL